MGSLLVTFIKSRMKRACLTMVAATFVCGAFPLSAHAFSSFHAQISDYEAVPNQVADDERKPIVTNTPSSSVVDPCLPLLKSIHTSPSIATDRNQRSAGNTANLGLVFGVRFALSPAPKAAASRSKARFGFWQPSKSYSGDRAALAMNQYEDCRSRQALDALDEFRWKR